MTKDYSLYQVADFLTDDYFVESMLYPTRESEVFWKKLIDAHKIDPNEFISAYMALKNLHEQKPDVPEDRIDIIWERIVETNELKQTKAKRFKFIRYMAVACSIAILAVFSLFNYIRLIEKNQEQTITAFVNENRIHTKQPNDRIQLISGNETVEVEGAQAEVEYDTEGKLTVNKQSVSAVQTKQQSNGAPRYNELKVPYGKRAFLTLPDGTSVWVNTGTTVIYPVNFADDKREIYVRGEIYAEVYHEENRPFFIKTDKIDVKVLGTVLNVTAYKEDNSTSVVLVSGLVDVKPQNGKSTIIHPNQLFSYSDQASTLTTVDVENYTSWHEGVYIFKNEPIENILLRLSRYYNVTMKLPSHPSGISCSGKLELKDNLTDLLNGLSEITSMNFGVSNNEYKISFQ